MFGTGRDDPLVSAYVNESPLAGVEIEALTGAFQANDERSSKRACVASRRKILNRIFTIKPQDFVARVQRESGVAGAGRPEIRLDGTTARKANACDLGGTERRRRVRHAGKAACRSFVE